MSPKPVTPGPTRTETIFTLGILAVIGVILAALLLAPNIARAKPRPIPIPAELQAARDACPNGSSLSGCRGELRKALAAVAWQRKARQDAITRHWPGDAAAAIRLACARENMTARCGEFYTVATCESNLHPSSTNGQFKGLFQLGAMHRSDPIVQLLGWDDPYANALHTVRFVKAHSWSQWQCRPNGGLGW